MIIDRKALDLLSMSERTDWSIFSFSSTTQLDFSLQNKKETKLDWVVGGVWLAPRSTAVGFKNRPEWDIGMRLCRVSGIENFHQKECVFVFQS